MAACGRNLAKPFNGAVYIASQAARTLSIVNLSTFKLSKQVALEAEPTAVLTTSSRVFVLTPSNGTITELEARLMWDHLPNGIDLRRERGIYAPVAGWQLDLAARSRSTGPDPTRPQIATYCAHY